MTGIYALSILAFFVGLAILVRKYSRIRREMEIMKKVVRDQ